MRGESTEGLTSGSVAAPIRGQRGGSNCSMIVCTLRVALITGITGQDGALLAELLLNKGYIVHGVKRRSSSFNTGRIDHLYLDPHDTGLRFILHYGDMTDATNLIRIV